MIDEKDNKLTYVDENGNEVLCEILFTFHADEFNKDLVVVEPGNDVDSVIASIAVKPVDSMEFLYMTINVVK